MGLQAAPPGRTAQINTHACSPAPRPPQRRAQRGRRKKPGVVARPSPPGLSSPASWGSCGIPERCQLGVTPFRVAGAPWSLCTLSCEAGGEATLPGSCGVSLDGGAGPPHKAHAGFSPHGGVGRRPKGLSYCQFLGGCPLVSRAGPERAVWKGEEPGPGFQTSRLALLFLGAVASGQSLGHPGALSVSVTPAWQGLGD